jgi:two-component system, OmpR family, response regulator QseB
MRVLLVEDDRMIGEGVRSGLRLDGFAVDWVQDGRAAEVALESEHYDCVLLDLGLPRKNGIDVLRGLRQKRNDVPVVVLTARDGVADRIAGLDSGADDYVVKPFALDEVAARVRAVARRRSGRAEAEIRVGELLLKPEAREAQLNGTTLALSGREFAELLALAERAGAILSRAQLEERVYGWGDEVESNAIEVFIHSLRKKLGADFIRTVRGVGYMIPRAG